MSNKISKETMTLVEELAVWFSEEMLRLEERAGTGKYPIRNREARLNEHKVIAEANLVMLLNDIKRVRQSGKKKISQRTT